MVGFPYQYFYYYSHIFLFFNFIIRCCFLCFGHRIFCCCYCSLLRYASMTTLQLYFLILDFILCLSSQCSIVNHLSTFTKVGVRLWIYHPPHTPFVDTGITLAYVFVIVGRCTWHELFQESSFRLWWKHIIPVIVHFS